MKKNIILTAFLAFSLLVPFAGITQKDFVQQILLDKPVTAGKLKVFPSFGNDSNKYYYLPNKLRLATDDNGTPKFLFLYYVTNAATTGGESSLTIGKTGGYVHVVVGLHVLPEELDEAKQELKKINPKGQIMGPVVYRGGTMALVTKSVITNSSATNPDPNAKRVLGLGPAPVIEGDNVAVSFILDSLDAKIMWESLQSSTPDLSFNLNMTLGGYNSPIGFTIDMDWDKIYTHKIFNAGLATPILKSEIGIAAQELRENGSIKVVQVGEDANLQKLQDVLTNKLIEMAFIPFGAEGSPNWTELAKPLNDGKSFLDRATEQLAKETEAVERRNKEIRENNMKERQYADEENRKRRAETDARRKAAREEAERKEAAAEAARQKAESEKDPTKKAAADADFKTKASEAEDARKKSDAEDEKADADDIVNAFVQPTRTKPATGDPDGLGPAFTDPKNYKNADKPIEDLPEVKPDLKKEQELPTTAVVASYQQKKIRHKGHYTAEAKTYFTTTLAEPFGDNIGKVNCRDCIRKINTYDPLYVQREVICFLDGEIANDFNKYINYVTVLMRKKHAGGDITNADIVIKRNNFNLEGNQFKLLYGWMKGDDNRRNWLNYEFKTSWNFFGGATVETDWATTDLPAISLAAPVNKYTVNFKAKADIVKANNIRAITVRIYYKIGGLEYMKQTSLDVDNEVYSASLDYLLPRGQSEYEYEVEWTKGNSNVKSARTRASTGTIFVDEVR